MKTNIEYATRMKRISTRSGKAIGEPFIVFTDNPEGSIGFITTALNGLAYKSLGIGSAYNVSDLRAIIKRLEQKHEEAQVTLAKKARKTKNGS